MNIDENDFDFSLHAAYVGESAVGRSRGKSRQQPQQRVKTADVRLSQTAVVGGPKRGGTSSVSASSRTSRAPRIINDGRLMLDGSAPPKVRTSQGGFDHAKEISPLEMRYTGINRAIPTRRQRNSRLEKFVAAHEIPEGGSGQVVRVGGFVSDQIRQEIAVDFPHWVVLRDSYLTQLQELSQLVVKGKIDASDVARRQQFLLLLLALRKVSIRIVSEYKLQAEMTIQTAEVEHKLAAKSIKTYIETMPASLNYLDCEPFTTWVGARTLLNPLVSTQSINGAEALINLGKGGGLALDLRFMNDEELADSQEANEVLWSVNCEVAKRTEQHQHRHGNRHANERRNAAAVAVEDEYEEDMDRLRQVQQQHVIDELVPATSEGLLIVPQSRGLKIFLQGKSFLIHAWKQWRKAYLIRVRIPIMHELRAKAVLRKCFQMLNRNVWQCVKYRALQRHYHQKITVITFDAWKEYLKWCRRFHKIHNKSVRRIKRLFLRAMRRFADDVYDVRRFRYNNDMRHKKICFKGFKYNVILTKYELKKRLELMSSASLMERNTCIRCFSRWVQRSRLVHKLDDLEELVENTLAKAALIRWYLATRPVESNEPKLSFAERMKLRITTASANDGIMGGFTALISSTRNGDQPQHSPPPQQQQQVDEKAEAEIRRRNEERRRARVRGAWKLAAAGGLE